MSASQQQSLFGDNSFGFEVGDESKVAPATAPNPDTVRQYGASYTVSTADLERVDLARELAAAVVLDGPVVPPQPPPQPPEPEAGTPATPSIAGRELAALTPAQLVGELPKPWRIVARDAQGRDVVFTDHGPSALAARNQGVPVFVTTAQGHEILHAAEAVALDRAWPDDLVDWCDRKRDDEFWLLSRGHALGGAHGLYGRAPTTPEERAWFDHVCPEDAHLLDLAPKPREVSVMDVLGQLGLELVEAR